MQTVERTFAILRALADTGGAGVSEVARSIELPKSTVHRILSSLEDLKLVQRHGSVYVVGPGLASLTGTVASPPAIRDMCRPYLRDLASDFGEAAGLTVVEGRMAHYLDQVTGESAVTSKDWTGMRLPLHTVAGGLALMMDWRRSRVREYAAHGMAVNTSSTVGTAEGLLGRLDQARSDGFVWTLGDFDDEINGVGAPIVGAAGDIVAALSLYGPAYRYPGNRQAQEVGSRIREVADTISRRLAP